MKTPEELAREWFKESELHMETGRTPVNTEMAVAMLADLIRQRDAEHEALRREEREKAFDRGAATERRYPGMAGAPAFFAARRAAVESAGGAGEEQPCALSP